MKSICPLDGRYQNSIKELSEIFSEDSVLKRRTLIEIKYFNFISNLLNLKENISEELTDKDILLIKQIEIKGYKDIPATNHDGKAIEYFLKIKYNLKNKEYIHIGLTTEDITNLALSSLLKEGVNILKVTLNDLISNLKVNDKNRILGRTHGQIANITTFGHQFLIFKKRIETELKILNHLEFNGKLNGSVGTYSALKFAFPEFNWINESEKFIKSLDLIPVKHTTQVLNGECYSRVFHSIIRINLILLDLSRDVWRYISDKWLIQKVKEGEVGSSVMPHKVNPIDFENAEGNLKIANSLLSCLANELPISRLQRDLSDSTLKRNIGMSLGYSLLSYKKLIKGLGKIEPNITLLKELIETHPEVLGEAYQTELRKHIDNPYELLKKASRGKEITISDLHKLVDELDIPNNIKEKLKKLKQKDYLGEINQL